MVDVTYQHKERWWDTTQPWTTYCVWLHEEHVCIKNIVSLTDNRSSICAQDNYVQWWLRCQWQVHHSITSLAKTKVAFCAMLKPLWLEIQCLLLRSDSRAGKTWHTLCRSWDALEVAWSVRYTSTPIGKHGMCWRATGHCLLSVLVSPVDITVTGLDKRLLVHSDWGQR